MQIDQSNCTERKSSRCKNPTYEEIPLKQRSVSRSSSAGSIQDEIHDTLHNLLRKQKEIEYEQKVNNDWRALATKIDQILFYIFLLLTIISTVGLLVVVPLFRTNVQEKTKLWRGSRRP